MANFSATTNRILDKLWDFVLATALLGGLPGLLNAANIRQSALSIGPLKLKVISVAKADGVTVSNATVDGWLSTGSSALQADNTDSTLPFPDTPCPVTLTRFGIAISTFSSQFQVISSQTDFNNLAKQVSGPIMRVVERIDWCRGAAPPGFVIRGCSTSQTPKQSVLDNDAPSIFAVHEYGHFKGLSEYTDTRYGRYVMYSAPTSNSNVVFLYECKQYLK